MTRVGLVGCGGIAAIHADALRALAGVEIVGVADRDLERAVAFADGLPGAAPFRDLATLIDEVRPDAIHVLTPPSSHAELSILALRSGCDVLVEKPMALSVDDATRMIAAASESGRILCPNHNYLLKPSVVRARRLVGRGAIGDVVSVRAYYGISEERSSYGDGSPGGHWAWRLPGGVFSNFLPHMIYLVETFLGRTDEVVGVSIGPADVDPQRATELEVLLRGRGGIGTMVVSVRARPYRKFVEVVGTAGTLHIDLVSELCTVHRDHPVGGSIAKVTRNVDVALQILAGTASSAAHVVSGRWASMPGLREVVRGFHGAIDAAGPPPVDPRDGAAVARVLERIRESVPPVSSAVPRPQPRTRVERRLAADPSLPDRVAVTGASGYLGQHLVAALARCGLHPVVLVRDRSRVPFELEDHTEVVVGDLTDPTVARKLVAGIEVVFHCAAATRNRDPWSVHQRDTVEATRTLLGAAVDAQVGRVVHVSSVAVYGFGRHEGPVIEDAALPEPDRWANYQRAKRAAEGLVAGHRGGGLSTVVVRPGIIYGPGRAPTAEVAGIGSVRLLLGSGEEKLPYTHVDAVVEALLLAATVEDIDGRAFNIVDEPAVSAREVLDATDGDVTSIRIPTSLVRAVASWLERRATRRGAVAPPRLARSIIDGMVREDVYDTTAARTVLGWTSTADVPEALARTAR